MSEFDPGEGWRPVDWESDGLQDPDKYVYEYVKGRTPPFRYWIREEPVPPLPTDRGTVIKVDWSGDAHEWVVLWGGLWHNVATGHSSDLSGITGFEVVAEPRAVTAKAVLDEVRNTVGARMEHINEAILTEVGHQFGVDS